MKEAMYYVKKEDKSVQCVLCPWRCVISDGERGLCGVRENKSGKLAALVYGRPVSVAIDPIEKKPLFHFLPGSSVFSIGTVGCNFRCKHCQNWQISQEREIIGESLMPAEVVEKAVENGCSGIAYTYNEPSIFFEYVYDTAKLARKKGLRNIMVTNGYINEEPLKELYAYIDAANVDLKGFTEKFYANVIGAHLQPVLNTILRIGKMKTWLEITNLVIPTKNDNLNEIKKMCEWIVGNVGRDVPLHFSRFFPYYKLSDISPTDPDVLIKARKIAMGAGLNYVYIGNMLSDEGEITFCPESKKVAIDRKGYAIVRNNVEDGKCSCGEKIAGVWR